MFSIEKSNRNWGKHNYFVSAHVSPYTVFGAALRLYEKYIRALF